METALTEIFRHNLWANLRLLEACESLDDGQLDTTVPGTYGRIRDTLLHILACEEIYVNLLTGQEPVYTISAAGGFPSFEELRQRARLSGEELISIAGQIDPAQALRGTWRTRPRTWTGRPFTIQSFIPLVQVINHSTEHRSHVSTALTQLGIRPPAMDAWAYGLEKGTVELGEPE